MRKLLSLLLVAVVLAACAPKPLSGLTPEMIAETKREMCQDKTSEQIQAYTDSLKGKRVQWTGRILDVRHNRIYISVGDWNYGFEVDIPVPKDSRFVFSKGNQILFQGEIARVTPSDRCDMFEEVHLVRTAVIRTWEP